MYPKTLSKFRAWGKAMENNATVGTPDYGKKRSPGVSKKVGKKRRRLRKRRQRKGAKNG